MKTKTKEIIAGNKLIAEFLGWLFRKGKFTTQLSNSSGEYYDHVVEEEIWWDADVYPREEGLQFYHSWDALMPVVIKIHDDASTYQDGTSYEYRSKAGHVVSYLATLSREKVWKEVVAFIKWYNKNERIKG